MYPQCCNEGYRRIEYRVLGIGKAGFILTGYEPKVELVHCPFCGILLDEGKIAYTEPKLKIVTIENKDLVIEEAINLLSQWAGLSGQEMCWHHPDYLIRLCKIFNISIPDKIPLPPE